MSALRTALTLFVVASPIAAHAANSTLPAVTVESSNRVVIDCASQHLPKMTDVAKIIGSENSRQTYVAREHLMEIAKSHCARGVAFVQFIPGTESQAKENGYAVVVL